MFDTAGEFNRFFFLQIHLLIFGVIIILYPKASYKNCHCEGSCEAKPKQTGARFLTIFGTSSAISPFLKRLPRTLRVLAMTDAIYTCNSYRWIWDIDFFIRQFV